MFTRVYQILTSFLGPSKLGYYDSTVTQYQFNCPYCAEEKGGIDGKFNLEISFAIGKFHCWACDSKGTISYLIRKFGGNKLLEEYKKEIASIEESKLYDISEYQDLKGGNKDENGNYLCLPEGFKPIDLSIIPETSKLSQYLKKRGINQSIIDKFHIGYIGWNDTTEKSMKNRIIIPSYDQNGYLNYWVARDFSGLEKRIKYKNCKADKQNIIFQDSLINYNADILLVEGAIDCLYYPNTIALLGKFLTKKSEIYSRLIEKAKGDIIVCLDADTSIQETDRICRTLNIGNLRGKIKYIRMEKYKDFGEAYEADKKNALLEVVQSKITYPECGLS